MAIYLIYPFIAEDDLKNVFEWMNSFDSQNLNFEFVGEEIWKFEKQILEMENSICGEDEKRVNQILELLKKGELPFAIFVDGKDNFILEGRHRVVAFKKFGLKVIPVYYVSKKEENNKGM